MTCKPNKPWIKASTLFLEKEKREMKQRDRNQLNMRRSIGSYAMLGGKQQVKEDWLQEQCQEIERCAEGIRCRKAYKL